LALTGTLHVAGPGDAVRFLNTQTFSNGTISIEGPSGASRLMMIADNSTLTLAPNAWVHGGGGTISGSGAPTVGLINHGRITSDLPGRTLTVQVNPFTSDGILEVASGSTMKIGR